MNKEDPKHVQILKCLRTNIEAMATWWPARKDRFWKTKEALTLYIELDTLGFIILPRSRAEPRIMAWRLLRLVDVDNITDVTVIQKALENQLVDLVDIAERKS